LLWQNAVRATDELTDHFQRRPGKWTVRAIRALILVFSVLLGPFILLVQAFRRPHERPSTALYHRVREVWQASPFEALALVRTTYETLQLRGDGWKTVELPPFGRFNMLETLLVHDLLFRCEFALGRYAEAMQVSASLPARLPTSILQQVDCLMAMGRRADAIAHLEKNLDIDTWREPLRRRMQELWRSGGGRAN
jgi:hypothetical protein